MRHAVLLGASRGIAYYTTLNLLSTDEWTCTLLLRKPGALAADPKLAPYVESGRVVFVKGDGTNVEDVAKLFDKPADVVITSIGGAPRLTLHGFGLDQPRVCTEAAETLLKVLGKLDGKPPRVIAVSSMGMGNSHKYMPLAWRILYPWALHQPHLDKEGLEYLMCRASTTLAVPEDHIPPPDILPRENIPQVRERFLPEVIIVRPALLTGDGPLKGKDKTKVSEDLYSYTVTRMDVAAFISDECVQQKSKWVNKLPIVGY